MQVYLDSLNRINDQGMLTVEMIAKAVELTLVTEEEAATIVIKEK